MDRIIKRIHKLEKADKWITISMFPAAIGGFVMGLVIMQPHARWSTYVILNIIAWACVAALVGLGVAKYIIHNLLLDKLIVHKLHVGNDPEFNEKYRDWK